MNWKSHFSGSKGRGLVGGALTAVVGLICTLIQGFSDRSYDLLFRFRPPIDVSKENVVIVDMDDESGEFLGEPSTRAWNRETHAHLIQQLGLHQAGVVAFDVLFRDPGTNDLALLSAATNHGRVYFAARCEVQTTPTGEAAIGHVNRPFGGSVAMENVGLVEDSQTEDRFIRQHQTPKMKVPSLAWKIADLNVTGLVDASAPRWFNYYGPAGTVPHISYWRVISNSLPSSISLTNKVVFVGARATIGPTGGTGTDYLPTPYDKLTPGVEINATAYLNLVRDDWLTRLPTAAERVLFVVFGLLGGYGLSLLRPLQMAGYGLLTAAGTLVLAVLLFRQAHFWFPWLVVVAAQIPSAAAWSLLSYTTTLAREKEVLAEKWTTATANAEAPTAIVPATSTLAIPAIPDHTLVRCVGKGAYGEVWLARDIIGNYHAVKIVHRRTFPSAGPYEREFKGIQRYTPISRSHPGWVHILHVGRNDAEGYFFIIMEVGDDQTSGQQIDPATYVPRNLAREKQSRGRIPLDECLQLGLALAAAVEHLHQHQLIHRDIKPSNVIFVSGAPKFADIGLVTDLRATEGDVSYLGTDGYIAPEGPGTAAADVYSLGKLLYEISMGRDRLEFPELPTSLVEKVNEPVWYQLNEILLKACAPSPSKRYQSAAQLQADLLRLQSSIAAQAQSRAQGPP